MTLASAGVWPWLQKFPEWGLIARNMPPAPTHPLDAIARTIATTNGLDPDVEVAKRKKEGIADRIDNWDQYQERYLKPAAPAGKK